jgi:hypothetical protein
MIPVGQPYRAAGTLDAKSLLITAILATTAAVLGAAAVWLWELSPIPTLLILTPLIQGAGVGAVMAFAIGRLRLRNPRTVAVVAFLCGLFSNGLVHYGHYLHLVSVTATQLKDEVALDKSMPEDKRAELLARLDAAPATVVDSILAQETQHSGFVGSLFLRNRQGITIKSSAVTGTMLWIVWAAEALLVAIIASVIAAERAAKPFCEDCGYWCEKHADLFAIRRPAPTRWFRPSVKAITRRSPVCAAVPSPTAAPAPWARPFIPAPPATKVSPMCRIESSRKRRRKSKCCSSSTEFPLRLSISFGVGLIPVRQ